MWLGCFGGGVAEDFRYGCLESGTHGIERLLGCGFAAQYLLLHLVQ